MSNYQGYGTVNSVSTIGDVVCRGWVTISCHVASGTIGVTWQFKGPDGVYRDIYAGSDNVTVQTYSATHQFNVFFGNDVRVRGNVTTATGLTANWQIIGNLANR